MHRRGERARNMNCLYDSKTKEVIVGLRGCHVPPSHLHVSRAEVDVAHSFKFSPPNLQSCPDAAKIISIILPHCNTANTDFFTMFFPNFVLLTIPVICTYRFNFAPSAFCIDVIVFSFFPETDF